MRIGARFSAWRARLVERAWGYLPAAWRPTPAQPTTPSDGSADAALIHKSADRAANDNPTSRDVVIPPAALLHWPYAPPNPLHRCSLRWMHLPPAPGLLNAARLCTDAASQDPLNAL